MKNCFKKFSMVFVMTFAIILGCCTSVFAADNFEIGTSNLNETLENSAKIGDRLLKPELGWKRYDDINEKISYVGNWSKNSSENYYKSSYTYCYVKNSEKNITYCTFKFYGTKLRIISEITNVSSNGIKIDIDGKTESYNQYVTQNQSKITSLVYEKTGLENTVHEVKIYADETTDIHYYLPYCNYSIDAIDIDENSYLLGTDEVSKSILLNKSSLTLKDGSVDNLIATTTPSGVQVNWVSSNESIATVDQTGKVTGVKEGTCTVTATIDGTDIKAECIVNVTKEETSVEPEEPSGNGSLYIEMLDGNIKQAQNLNTSDFIKWYQNRDLDKTEKPFYKITNAKGNVEYLIHDKIVAFEIR
ncbi:Ig-like domain-containing protein [Clostridium butyricum]|uniref:Ig-like domain-containing protein n=1 Tax=Clostridium butyricum TaxID=1492 RepID=UPI002ABE4AAA|nr:Ig-like domain-containing protein [Clostridium butyricum]